MEDLTRLREIGAREIAKQTHMAINRRQEILDLEFGNLKDRATTIGLIKILEREYSVNLEKWIEEYDLFWQNDTHEKDELTKIINFKITHESAQQNSFTKVLIILIFILAILGGAFYVYTNLTSIEELQNPSKLYTQKMPQTITPDSIPQQEEREEFIEKSDSITTQEESKEEYSKTSSDIDEDNSTSNLTTQSEDESNTQEEIASTNKLEINPSSNVWIGIIYLDDKKRVSLTTDQPIEIDLQRPQTIVTGHGMLSIFYNGETIHHNQANKMRFFVDGKGNFMLIDNAKYNEYNGSLGW